MDDNDGVYLTKAELLKGKTHTETVKTSLGTFMVRSLTLTERGAAEALVAKGIKTSGKSSSMRDPYLEGDAHSLLLNQSEYNKYVIACGLTIEGKDQWSPREVGQLTIPEEDVEKLLNVIETISGMKKLKDNTAKRIETFREVSGGSGASQVNN